MSDLDGFVDDGLEGCAVANNESLELSANDTILGDEFEFLNRGG